MVRKTAAALTVALATAVGVGLAVSNSDSPVSPVHVAAVFADGFTQGDFRQVCSVIAIPNDSSTWECERNLGETGVTPVRVVAHSQRVWTEKYRGREVELAYVEVQVTLYQPDFVNLKYVAVVETYRLQMVKTDHGWRVRAVTYVTPGSEQ